MVNLTQAEQKEKNHWNKEYARNFGVEKFPEISQYWWKADYQEENSFFLQNFNLTKESVTLEAGSGSGNSSLLLAKSVRKVTLLDISENSLKSSLALAKYHRVKNFDLVKGSIFKLPFSADSFDFTFNIGVIEHYSLVEIRKIVTEMIKVTKPDGYICLGVPNKYSMPILKAKLLSSKEFKPLTSWIKGYRLNCEKFYSNKELVQIIKKSAKTTKSIISDISITYLGSFLPVETPEFLFKLINPIFKKLFNSGSFITAISFKIEK